jgi:hypothetical protein
MLVNADNGDGVRFLACIPKRQNTAAWQRYITYKVSTTVSDALKLGVMSIDIKHDLKHCFAWKLRGVVEASLHAALGVAEASLHAAPSSILAASTNQAVRASLHAAPSEEASREKDDSNGEALEIVCLEKATRRSRNCEHSCMRCALLFHGCVMRRSSWRGTSTVCVCSCGQSVQQFRD